MLISNEIIVSFLIMSRIMGANVKILTICSSVTEIEFLSLKFIFRQNVSILTYMKERSINSRYRFCVINISAFA